MTAYLPELAGGALAGAGLAMAAAALVPAPPDLRAAITRLHGDTLPSPSPGPGRRVGWSRR